MTRMSKKRVAELAAINQATGAATEAGMEYQRAEPELLLAEVHREANRRYFWRYEVEAFVEGFTAARRRGGASVESIA